MKRPKSSVNHHKYNRGPEARRAIRRKHGQPKSHAPRVLFAGKPKKRKTRRYSAPASGFKWRP